jgi:hypothetical protein
VKIALEHPLPHQRQAIKTLAHIGVAGRQPYPRPLEIGITAAGPCTASMLWRKIAGMLSPHIEMAVATTQSLEFAVCR